MSDTVQHALAVTLRGCEELIPQEAWVKKLIKSEATGQPLRIKLGLDPTAPEIHIGHTVVLNKMRQLQDLGHQVIFLIGDFTSLIGDPSGRNSTPSAAHTRANQRKRGDLLQASLFGARPRKNRDPLQQRVEPTPGCDGHDPTGRQIHRGAHDGAQRLP